MATATIGERAALLGASTPLEAPSARATAVRAYGLVLCAALLQSIRAMLFHVGLSLSSLPASAGLLVAGVLYTVGSMAYFGTFGLWGELSLPRKQTVQMTARGILSGCMFYLNAIALERVAVGTALTLFATAPAIAAVLAALFLGDAITWGDGGVLVANLVGVALVARPAGAQGPSAVIGVTAAIGNALLVGASFTLVKAMGTKVHFMLNLLAIGLGSLTVCLFVVDAATINAMQNDWRSVVTIVLGSVAGFASQSLLNRGMQQCRPGLGLVVRSANVPASFILGFIFLSETVPFSALLGALLVVVSISYIGITQATRRTASSTAHHDVTAAKSHMPGREHKA